MYISDQQHLLTDSLSMSDLKEKIRSYREQEKIRDKWLKNRLETILPKIMIRAGIDLWIVACNEYNEDPVLKTLVPCAMMTARRLTILVYHLQDGNKVRTMSITRPGVGLDDYYEAMWTNPKGHNWNNISKSTVPPETQWECLNRVITECAPEKIGINISEDFAFADGLSHTLYDQLMKCLNSENQKKVVSAEKICVGWLETRSKEEMAAYNAIIQIAHAMIAEAFSSRVIVPGVTTNADVKYFMFEQTIKLGLRPWFDYEVSIIREGEGEIEEETVIMPGDILHCDVGFSYLDLCTDTQENCYILKAGEDDAPVYLKEALKKANRLQDIVIAYFKEGRSGNEVLKMAREQALSEGLEPCIYTHPLGNHGHGAGPLIGLWDMQQGVPGKGDYPLYNDTAYALELNVSVEIREWKTRIRFGVETDILFTDNKVYYLGGRQIAFHLVK